MNRSAIRSAGITITLSLIACLAALQPAHGQKQKPQQSKPAANVSAHVIMISIDGLPGRYVTSPDRFDLRIPTLRKMKLDGAFAEGVESVYPTVTYPAHTTLTTGVYPARHGILMNAVYRDPTQTGPDPWYWESKDILVPTLWDACRKAGLSVASVWWPVTKGARIPWDVPEFWHGDSFPPTLEELAAVSTAGLVEGYLNAAGLRMDTKMSDPIGAGLARYLIEREKPHLLLLHLANFDKQCHDHGLGSKECHEALEATDTLLAQLVESVKKAGIEKDTTFVLVSDHGFAAVDKSFNPYVALAREKLVTVSGKKIIDWKVAVWKSSGSAAIVLRDPNDKPTASTVLKLFTNLAESPDPPIRRIYTREELVKLGANPKALLMFDAAPGYTIGSAVTGPMVTPSTRTLGQHGYTPSSPDMLATLILNGRGVRIGSRISYTRMVNVAPTVADLLGVDLPASEGTALTDLINASLVRPKIKPSPGKRKPDEKSQTP